tara:strand:- start:606 stop:833 length:228 start_codon:yes stop_codon:yes gene_type:complete
MNMTKTKEYPACHKLGLSVVPHHVDNAMSMYAAHHALSLRLDPDLIQDHLQAVGELNRILLEIKTNLPEAWEETP